MEKDLHLQDNPTISFVDSRNVADVRYLDVRAPSEYRDGCIPTAYNIPLLTDEERTAIGCLYRSLGQSSAIEKGYDFFFPKLDYFSNSFSQFNQDDTLVIYCARGGMRSRVITAFLNRCGFKAKQLVGGYKAFRQWNLEALNSFKIEHPVVLHGKTGVGKTLVLELLENALNLEALAHHRGSLFGGIGKHPTTQKHFEAALIERLQQLDNRRPVFIEGESQRIGNITLPTRLFQQMKTARMVLLEAPMTVRVQRTIEAYIRQQPAFLPDIRQTIQALQNDLGKKPVDHLLTLFDNGDYESCFESILKHYYDKRYAHSLDKIHFDTVISSEDIAEAVARIEQLAGSNQHDNRDQPLPDDVKKERRDDEPPIFLPADLL